MLNGTAADYGKPGDHGCGEQWEVCLSVAAARHYYEMITYAEEIYSKCKRRP